MKEHGVIFNGEMVRVILDGRKTQTRRPLASPVLKNAKVGDLIYVRETWQYYPNKVFYRADGEHQKMGMRDCAGACFHVFTDGLGDGSHFEARKKWQPSIYTPKWAARIWLKITAVSEENLQDIDGRGVWAEGLPSKGPGWYPPDLENWFSGLWDSVYGKKYPWADNPRVRKITFERWTK